MTRSIVVLVCCLLTFVSLGQGGSPVAAQEPAAPSAAANSQQDQSVDDATIAQEEANAANRKQLNETLTNEIASLTPGNLKDVPELKTKVSAAIDLLLDNKAEEARAALDALVVNHAAMPPVDLQLAAIYFAINNATEGSRLLEEAATVRPDLPTIYNAFARLAILQRRKTDALALLEKSKLAIDGKTWPENERTHYETSYLDAMADLMMLRRDFSAARDYLNQVTAKRPNDSRCIMRLAEVDFAQDQIPQCLDRLREFHTLVPDGGVPELLMARFFSQAGRLSDADEWVEKSRSLYSNDVKVLIEYALWMVSREQFDKATDALNAVDVIQADMPDSKLLQGKIAFAKQEYDTAEQLFESLRVSQPGNAEVANMWALSLVESTDPEKMAKALEVAAQNAQLQPQNPVAMAILGWALYKQNRLPQAQEWLGRAGQSRALTPEVAYFFAQFLYSQGQNEQALQFVTQALEQPGLFLYRTTARELRKEILGADKNESTPKK